MTGDQEVLGTEEGVRQIPLGASVEEVQVKVTSTKDKERGVRRAFSSSAKFPAAPRSNNFRLPLKMPDVQKSQAKRPRLIHPSIEVCTYIRIRT
jgi:hypothetical protein